MIRETPTKNRITLKDIAEEEGVSQGLVSLALADSKMVNPETKAKIILRALQMGYDINKRRIRQTREDIFTLVCTDASYLNTFFWSEVIQGMENYLQENEIGLDLQLYDPKAESDFLLNSINKRTKGFIVIATCDRKIYGVLKKANLPIVVLDPTNYYGMDCDYVESTNYYSAYNAARYLVSKGHKHLCFVGNINEAMSFKQRRNGFRDGCHFADKKIFYTEIIDEPSAKQKKEKIWAPFNEIKVKKLLKEDKRPSALFCANDFTAHKVWEIMKELGLDCPADVSLIGYDNIHFDDQFEKQLTTFDINKKYFGEVAVRMLQKRIRFPDLPKQVKEIIAPLIERKSVSEISIKK